MKKFIPLFVLIVVLILIGFATFKLNSNNSNNYANEDTDLSFQKVKISLPDFAIKDLYSEEKSLSKKDLIGKYSIINFFASWCVNCKAEHEFFMRLKEKNIIDIYGIAMKDREESTKRFLINSGNPYKKIGKDAEGAFSKSLNVEAIPETWIVDKEGNVIMKTKYNFDMKTIIEIISFINLKNESSK